MGHLRSPPCLTVRKAIHDNAAMAERIIIERLEFYGHCGVTEDERRKAQLIAVDLELEASVASAALSDRLDETIDYAQVADRLVALGASLDCKLLEAMAEQLIGLVLRNSPWTAYVYGSVSSMPPSRWWLDRSASDSNELVPRTMRVEKDLCRLPF